MNQTQKKFILNKLIPFIEREQGRGFVMEAWINNAYSIDDVATFDGVERKIPACGTVCCIGGSVQHLKGFGEGGQWSTMTTAHKLGLTYDQVRALFYGWRYSDVEDGDPHWPIKFIRRFDFCTTARGKARVATDLLREVVRTDGKCLVTILVKN